MRAGQLREIIKIYSITEVQNTTDGGFQDVRTLLCNTRAKVDWVSGRQAVVADQLFQAADIRLTIRYRSNITEGCEVVLRDQSYTIDYLEEIGYKEGLILRCNKMIK